MTAPASSSPGRWRSEAAGALGAVAALLPFVISYGVIAFGVLGPAAATAGLTAAVVAAVVGCLAVALFSGSRLPSGSPSATGALMLSGAVAALAGDPLVRAAPPAQALSMVLAGVAVTVMGAGLLMLGLGLLRTGRLVRFVPQPALSGFMNGVAVLIMLSQLAPMLGLPADAWARQGLAALAQWHGPTLAVAAGTAALVVLAGRLAPRAPAALLALGLATAAVAALQATTGPLGLRTLGQLEAPLPQWDTLAALQHEATRALLLRQAVPLLLTALLLAGVGGMESLLNLAAIDQLSGSRSDPDRELVALGLGNLLCGALGGLPLLVLRLRAAATWASGGRGRRSVALGCLLLALLFTLGRPLLERLPLSVVAGLVLMLGWSLLDPWSLGLLRQWRRGDRGPGLQWTLAVVLLVGAVTVVFGFVAGVGAGVLASMLLVIRLLDRALVRTRSTAVALQSRRARGARHEAALAPARAHIHALELEGALFFGNSDRLRAETEQLPAGATDLVVDLRRVSTLDASAAMALARADEQLRQRGVRLRLAGVSPDNRHGQALAAQGLALGDEGRPGLWSYPDADRALEAAEEDALERLAPEMSQRPVPLEACQLFEGLDETQRRLLRRQMHERRLALGERLFGQGDDGQSLFVVTAGSVSVRDPAGNHRYASFSPGMCFGETAVLDGAGRTADAVADAATVVHELSSPALADLQRTHPELAAQVYRNLARHLSARLRAAAASWRAAAG